VLTVEKEVAGVNADGALGAVVSTVTVNADGTQTETFPAASIARTQMK
jgi:hypothetical protein